MAVNDNKIGDGDYLEFEAKVADLDKQIKELGATNIILRTKRPNSASEGQDANSRVKIYGLRRDDHRRVVETIPGIRRAVPMREVRYELRLDNRTADSILVGCVEDYLELNRLEVSRGAVVAAMGQLVAAGVILRGPRQGRVYTYRLPRPHTPSRSTGGTTGI